MQKILSLVGTFLVALPTLYSQCLEGDCLNGQGTYRYQNGATYTGQFQRARLHGIGAFQYSNGDVYTGEWVQNKREGEGTLTSPGNVIYKGEWKDNKFDGFGILTFPDGRSFESHWKEGNSLGYGMLRIPGNNPVHGRFEDGNFIFAEEDGAVQQSEEGESTQEPVSMTLSTSDQATVWNGKDSGKVSPGNPVEIHALIVGVSRYIHFPTLKYTDDDAYRMYAFLRSPEGGAVPDRNVTVLIDEGASRDNIMTSLRETLRRADANDAVFIYISGHGLNGSYLPFDSDGYQRAIAYTELRDALANTRAKQTLCIADACYSGSMLGQKATISESIDQFYRQLNDAKGGLAFLLSSKPEEYSLESQGLRQGIFSHYLIAGLGGKADANRDKMITISELYGFVRQAVIDYTGGVQTPLLAGNFDNQMPVGLLR